MNAEVRFVLPGDDATDDDRWRALEIIGAIPMTIDQLERGNAAYHRVYHAEAMKAYEAKEMPQVGLQPGDLAQAELERFCLAEGLLPADVAAHAMRMRYYPVEDARSGCVDLETDYPETYAGLVAGPIDPDCMDFADPGSMPPHVEGQWAALPITDAELPY